MTTALKVESLSKRFQLGLTHAKSIRELVNGMGSRLLGRNNQKVSESEFWALKDISFEVKSGEVVGIIGKNGAGKSTLLKILSQITKPTSGRAVLRGRVASLLEVGTGFHPELTGRENIFLNGTILGMSKQEVATRFDEIVAFSGIEKFIDTPVKRYSSGMTVRLGFAVAAHLEPEILIVDEVLAVGDVEFQKRCLSKMQDVANSGRTVLFVSHNLSSIRNLTSRCVVLKQGEVTFDGGTSDAIDTYIRLSTNELAATEDVRSLPRPFSGLSQEMRFSHLSMREQDRILKPDANIRFRMGVEATQQTENWLIGMTIFRNDDTAVGGCFSAEFKPLSAGSHQELELEIPTPPLAPGNYYCGLSLVEANTSENHVYDSLTNVLPFEVTQAGFGKRFWKSGWGLVRFHDLMAVREGI